VRETLLFNGNRYDQVIMDLVRTEFELKHVGCLRDLAPAPGAAL
jgi:hypothetical protein